MNPTANVVVDTNPLLMPEEKTFELLSAKAQAADDRFMVRIFRATGQTGLGNSFAMFANVTVAHLAAADPWLNRLGGGGKYTMRIAHMDETQKPIGGYLKFNIPGEQRPINMYAPQSPEWEGPILMTSPPMPTAADQAALQGLGMPPGAVPVLGQRPGWNYGQPAPFAAPFTQTQQAPGVPADSLFLREQAARAGLDARERELAARETAMATKQTEREEALKRSELEQRLRAENERARAESAAHIRALDEKISRLLDAPKQDGGGIDKVIAAVATFVTPIATALLNGQAESRVAAQRQAAEAAQQQNTLLTSLLNKPAPSVPPEMTMMFEMMKSQSTGSGEMLSRMVEVMGAVSKSSVAMVEVMADMGGGGPPENPMIEVIREGVKAIGGLVSASKDGAKKQIANQQRQMQPPQQQPQPNPGNSQQGGHWPNGQNGQQNGHNNAPGSQATPQQSYGGQGAVATGPQAPAQKQQSAISEPTRTTVEELERLIRGRYEPIEKVADFFVMAVKNKEPVMQAALDEFDGEINELLEDRLGDWIEESTQNGNYILRLAKAVDTAGMAAGIFRVNQEEEEVVQIPQGGTV